VARRGYHELITQLYFSGEPLNAQDQLLQALPPAERERVTVALEPAPADLGAGALLCHFEITLRKVS
jgi:protocatechuate 3,4-dioxygenase beta subunit